MCKQDIHHFKGCDQIISALDLCPTHLTCQTYTITITTSPSLCFGCLSITPPHEPNSRTILSTFCTSYLPWQLQVIRLPHINCTLPSPVEETRIRWSLDWENFGWPRQRREQMRIMALKPQEFTTSEARFLIHALIILDWRVFHEFDLAAVNPALFSRLAELNSALSTIPADIVRNLPILEMAYVLRSVSIVMIPAAQAYPENTKLVAFVESSMDRWSAAQQRIDDFNVDRLVNTGAEEMLDAAMRLCTLVSVDDLLEGERQCAICRVEYVSSSPPPSEYELEEKKEEEKETLEQPVRLNCRVGHIFGQECTRAWLMESKTCPYCRYNFDNDIADILLKDARNLADKERKLGTHELDKAVVDEVRAFFGFIG